MRTNFADRAFPGSAAHMPRLAQIDAGPGLAVLIGAAGDALADALRTDASDAAMGRRVALGTGCVRAVRLRQASRDATGLGTSPATAATVPPKLRNSC